MSRRYLSIFFPLAAVFFISTWPHMIEGPVDVQWARRSTHEFVDMTDGDALYVTGDYTVALSRSGEILWHSGFDELLETGFALDVDDESCVFVVGHSFSFSTGYDLVLSKYAPDGTRIWRTVHDGGFNEVAKSVVNDGAGGACIVGADNARTFVAHVNESGTVDWSVWFTGRAWNRTLAKVPGGYAVGCNRNDNYLIAKCEDGAVLWEREYDNGGEEFLKAVCADAQGMLYVTGRSEGLAMDFATLAISPENDLRWVSRYENVWWDGGRDVAVDDSGNVFVTGRSEGIATVKYAPDGREIWVHRIEGEGLDGGASVLPDEEGGAIVCGILGKRMVTTHVGRWYAEYAGIRQTSYYQQLVTDGSYFYALGGGLDSSVFVTYNEDQAPAE